MKIKFYALLCMLTFNAYAGQDRGGGDLCENRIKVIRNDLENWINDGGPNGLSLPTGIDVNQYSTSMLQAIGKAKIKCVSEGDRGYPVRIGSTAKVCRFDKSYFSQTITCDFKKFQSMPESDQYILIHHEFAGIAGIENPRGDSSEYEISNQISGFLKDKVVKQLSIVTSQPTTPQATKDLVVGSIRDFFKKNPYYLYCTGDLYVGEDDLNRLFNWEAMRLDFSMQINETQDLITFRKKWEDYTTDVNFKKPTELAVEIKLSEDLKSVNGIEYSEIKNTKYQINVGTITNPKYEDQIKTETKVVICEPRTR